MINKSTTWTDAEKKTARLLRAFDKLCNDYHTAIDRGEKSIPISEITEVLQMAEYTKEVDIIG